MGVFNIMVHYIEHGVPDEKHNGRLQKTLNVTAGVYIDRRVEI